MLLDTGDEVPGDTVEQHLDREGEGKGGVAQSYESFGRTIAGGKGHINTYIVVYT